MKICVVNESKLVSDEEVDLMCRAVEMQMMSHVFPAWDIKSGTIELTAKSKVPADAWLVNLLDDPTAAGALGYHADDSDRVCGYIFAGPVLENGGVVLFDKKNPQNMSVSSVLSHEVLEMVLDPYATTWVTGPAIMTDDGETYTDFALELCDAVQGGPYSLVVDGYHVSLSDFILPAWTNPQAVEKDGPFNYLSTLTAPFTMGVGGYMILKNGHSETQVFGEKVSEQHKAHVKSEWYHR